MGVFLLLVVFLNVSAWNAVVSVAEDESGLVDRMGQIQGAVRETQKISEELQSEVTKFEKV